ncbi:MAG TPA: C39 family peptidase [Polyangia bacterium]|nr:C39 family peptidase [Polyangia bacterium]
MRPHILHALVALTLLWASACSPAGGASANDVTAESAAWSCAASQYQGSQYWTCANGSLNKCDGNGSPERASCGTNGCKSNPPGIDDQCNWSCAASQYQGNQYWTCANGSLNKCGTNGPEITYCGALGCKSNAAGIDDQCYLPSPGWNCASSRGSDGSQYFTCAADGNVHECVNGSPIELACSGGCNHNPANTDDTCKGSSGGGGVPGHVRAAAGNGYAVVRWTPSVTAQSGFTIVSSPGDITVHAATNATQAIVSGLGSGVSYTFAVSQDGGSAAHTNAVLPGADANVIVDVVHHPQTRTLTCEEASLVMALSHERITRTEDDVLSDIGIDWTAATFDGSGNLHWGDPYAHFVGSPDGDEAAFTGYGVYAPPIARAASDFGATVLSAGQSNAPQAIYDAVLAAHPVVAWVTTDWSFQARQRTWITDDGTDIGWYGPHEHAVAVVGVERDVVVIDNPLQATEWQRVAKSQFEASFQTFANMAVILH